MSVITDYIVKLSLLKLSNDTFNSIWIVVDWYIKITYFIFMTEMMIKYRFIKLYLWKMLKYHNLFKKFISNWSKLFNNKLIKKLYKETNIICNLLMSYHLQTDD